MATASKAKSKLTAKAAKPKAKAAAATARWSHGKVYWSELNTHEAAKAKKFYTASLGWKYDAMPMPDGTYWIIKAGDELVGGMFEMKGPMFANVPEHWLTYIAVDNVDARVKKAVANGGKVCRPAFDIPGVGRIAIIEQPGGGMVGWMTPKEV